MNLSNISKIGKNIPQPALLIKNKATKWITVQYKDLINKHSILKNGIILITKGKKRKVGHINSLNSIPRKIAASKND